jgi:hypothetical protein
VSISSTKRGSSSRCPGGAFSSTIVVMRSRVTPGVGSTIEMRRPASRLKRLDLPTFGGGRSRRAVDRAAHLVEVGLDRLALRGHLRHGLLHLGAHLRRVALLLDHAHVAARGHSPGAGRRRGVLRGRQAHAHGARHGHALLHGHGHVDVLAREDVLQADRARRAVRRVERRGHREDQPVAAGDPLAVLVDHRLVELGEHHVRVLAEAGREPDVVDLV